MNPQILRPFLACVLLLLCGVTSAWGQFSITGPGQIALPSLSVSAEYQSVLSGNYTLQLRNTNGKQGWLLTGEILNGALLGDSSGFALPATMRFKAIRWTSGPSGSTAGIAIASDGSRIEADPGFGRGQFDIDFEIQYDVPPFPRADIYRGVTTFSIL